MTIVTIYLIFSMLAVLWFDVRSYIIPNWLTGALVVTYPLAVLLSPVAVDWLMALAGMLAVFAVGYGFFAMKWMGGGDVKLITACALWVGFSNLLEFIFLFGIFGGVFSILVLVARKFSPFLKMQKLPRILRDREPIPYGVAIALAFLMLMRIGHVPLAVIA